MLSVPRTSSDLFRCARTAVCLAALAIASHAAPVFAAPAVDAYAPGVLAADYRAQSSPTTPARDDSGKFYAKMWAPRGRTGAIHLHGGVFAPINANAPGTTFGTRIGVHMGAPLLLGFLAGWTYESKSLVQPVNTGLPGLEPKTVLATATAQLIPAMAFLQVTLSEKYPLVPYVGVGAGYEWLVLGVKDYRTAAHASRTYSNWAWQSYAGMGMKLSGTLRLDGEVFYNGANLARDVYDANGVRWRETVNVNGAGARVGLYIAY